MANICKKYVAKASNFGMFQQIVQLSGSWCLNIARLQYIDTEYLV